MNSGNILEAIRAWLGSGEVPFVEKQHAATRTSEESARARGEPLKVGAKALVIKTDDCFRLFVLPADRKVDSQAIKRQLHVKKVRFANADELASLTGLPPGSVPPFGEPILSLKLFADPALCDNDKMAFNAGSLTTSIIMASADYRRIAGAQWLSVSQPA
jgi:Ala-tRNA(Pro) deacylase